MKINYTGIDWLTCTTTSDKVGGQWYEIFTKKAQDDALSLVTGRQWSNGYYSGLQTEGLQWGYSERLGYILIARSDTANYLWPYLQRRPRRVTRVDLCCDVVLAHPQPLASSEYNIIRAKLPKSRKLSLWESNDGGLTLYVGSRQSPQYGRLYDKGVESGLAKPGVYWRFEVEYKKPVSMAVTDHLADYSGEELAEEIQNRVADWFTERYCVFSQQIGGADVKPIIAMQRMTTKDRKLAWLRTQVSPTVRMLLEAGLGKQVALSLFQEPGDIRKMLEQAEDLATLP